MTKTLQCIHVIDDDPNLLDSLGMLLKAADFAVRTYGAPSKFFTSAAADLGGCVLTDLRMPEMSGIDLLASMKQLNISLPVVVMTAYADVALAVEAMKQGAVDFIEKPFDDHELETCLRSALSTRHGPRHLDDESPITPEWLAKLSSRENDVLAGIVDGKLNKVMAFELGISMRTVECHRAHLMAKAGVASVSELVRIACLANPHLLNA